jgi:hypothetical protein
MGTQLRALIDCDGGASGGWGSRGTSAELAGVTWSSGGLLVVGQATRSKTAR